VRRLAPRFLISGYYGFGNLGDEAILRMIVAGLRRHWPLGTIDVLSARPEETAHDHGVEATSRWDRAAVRNATTRADVVLSGGGGLLQNATSLKSLLYYAEIIRRAVHAGKPTMVFAQSIGPLDFIGKQTVRECCRGLAAATVRDRRSMDLLAPLVAGIEIRRTADPVFLYELDDEVDLASEGLGPDSEPLVIVAVRKTARFNEGIGVLAAAVDRLAERWGAHVAFVPFAGQPDAEAATQVIRKCRSKPVLFDLGGLARVAGAIRRASLVIGVRLHALILAARFGTPFLAVAYDPKVAGLAEDLAYPLAPLWTPGPQPCAQSVEDAVDDAWTRRAELSAALAEPVAAMRTLAEHNFTTLAETIGRA
jgi:polysaccharide pyruvyl transferase CsaB